MKLQLSEDVMADGMERFSNVVYFSRQIIYNFMEEHHDFVLLMQRSVFRVTMDKRT